MPKISIIMPVYNNEKYINEAINSVLNQTLDDIELICVNDGSTDSSLEILNEFSLKYDFIKVFTLKNQGSGHARNYALRKAKGEYIAYLDADDIFIDEKALEIMYNIGINNNALMISANLKGIELTGEFVINHNLKRFTKESAIDPEDYEIPYSFYKNIFKREFLINNKIDFPNLKRGQDPVFLAKILTIVNKIYTIPLDLYGFRYGEASSLLKINTYQKKYDYILHFKQTFDILNNADFHVMCEKYEEKLIEFIKSFHNNYSIEINEIVSEIFPENQKFLNLFIKPEISVIYPFYGDDFSFNKILNHNIKELEIICINYQDNEILKKDARVIITYENHIYEKINCEYIYFYNQFDVIDDEFSLKKDIKEFTNELQLFKLRNINSNEDFINVKIIFEKNQINLDNYHEKLLELLESSDNFDEFKTKKEILNLKYEINKLKNENKELKNKKEKFQKLNNEILNSKSWRLTKVFRRIKNN